MNKSITKNLFCAMILLNIGNLQHISTANNDEFSWNDNSNIPFFKDKNTYFAALGMLTLTTIFYLTQKDSPPIKEKTLIHNISLKK